MEEMGEALGISSINAVYELLRIREQKGRIERETRAGRGTRD